MDTVEESELNRFRRMSYDTLSQLHHLYKELGVRKREAQCLKVLKEMRAANPNFKVEEV
jgi:hypothetical protein